MLRGEKASICILLHQAHAEVDAIDGMARDIMRVTPGLAYEKARELAETV